jgi:outer membrane lipoprotein LolB
VKHFIWIFALTLTISGCSTIKPNTSPAPILPKAERETRLGSISSWRLNGKIAVQTNSNSGSASVDWFQRAGSYSIALQGPLGAGAMKLSGGPNGVTMIASDGKTFHAHSAEELLAKGWGFKLPVSNMNYWIRGLPAPGSNANTHYDERGRLQTLAQQGYRIDYLSYTNMGKIDLPEKLSITSPSLRVKIIVYQWNLA